MKDEWVMLLATSSPFLLLEQQKFLNSHMHNGFQISISMKSRLLLRWSNSSGADYIVQTT